MNTSAEARTQTSDNQLIASYKNMNTMSSLDILFQRYSHLVFCLCQKYLKNEEDSKDAVMEIFEKLVFDLKKYDISNFKSWLYVVAKNHCMMKLRQAASKNIVVKQNEEIEKIVVENPDFARHNNETDIQTRDLYAALDQLNEKQRLCIELFYFKKKTYKEIVETTGFEIRQVKSHIQNGKRNLIKYFNSKITLS